MTEHKTVTMTEPWGEKEDVEIDEGIAELVAMLWERDIRTSGSCQGGEGPVDGRAYIDFLHQDDAETFMGLVFIERDDLYENGLFAEYEAPGEWVWRGLPFDGSQIIVDDDHVDFDGPPKLFLEIQLRLPPEDIAKVVSAIKRSGVQ